MTMAFVLLGAALSLGSYLAASTVASVLVAILWPRARRGGARLDLLRALPSAAGAAVALGLVLPSYLAFEPAGLAEPIGLPLAVAATAAALLVVASAARAARVARATHATVRAWMDGSAPCDIPGGLPIPASTIAHTFPLVAVAGLVRPRLLIARQVVETLSAAELRAVAEHEMAHLESRDNLRTLLRYAYPDVLSWLPEGKRMMADVDQETEIRADARAAEGGMAVDLAAALIKVARLAPPGRLAVPLAALHDGGSISERVERLLSDRPGAPPRRSVGVAVLLAVIPLALFAAPILFAVHQAAELAVRFL
ncbi:MAG: M56 family metallopeptidase [Acidobacteriota bacterium]